MIARTSARIRRTLGMPIRYWWDSYGEVWTEEPDGTLSTLDGACQQWARRDVERYWGQLRRVPAGQEVSP